MNYKARDGTPLKATDFLDLANCPWCGTASPLIHKVAHPPEQHSPMGGRWLALYACRSCSHGILVEHVNDQSIVTMLPEPAAVHESIPERAAHYLREALGTKGNPSACIIVAASAVDAMLKAKGLREGTLNSRIVKALEQGILTKDMQAWADHVRLDANNQRHDDEGFALPTVAEAEDVVQFALALAQYLFILPARVKHFRKPGS